MTVLAVIVGGAIAAGIGGAVAHHKAKEKNEEAQYMLEEAQRIFDEAKVMLEKAQQRTQSTLLELGESKNQVLHSSVQLFVVAYNRVKHLELKESVGISEISKFEIQPHQVLQLAQMADIYESSLKNSAAGAATGAAAALIVGGVTVAPLAIAIAGPVALFTGISASLKATKNLDKAYETYAQAEKAVAEMEITITLCDGISDRAEMYDELLKKLNVYFAKCVLLLDAITKKRKGIFGIRKMRAKDLTQEERRLYAITRSLAGAVKAVIDTPILSAQGQLTESSLQVYNDIEANVPAYEAQVHEVENMKCYADYVRKQKKKKITAMDIVSGTFATVIMVIALPILIPWYIIDNFVKKNKGN